MGSQVITSWVEKLEDRRQKTEVCQNWTSYRKFTFVKGLLLRKGVYLLTKDITF